MKRSNLGPILLLCAVVTGYLALSRPYLFAYLLLAALVLVALGIAFVFGYDVFWFVSNRLSPVTRTQARVVRKRSKPWDVSIVGETQEMYAARMGTMGRNPRRAAKAYLRSAASGDAPEIDIASWNDYLVTFACDGNDIELLVPEETYIKCEEGVEGLLVFRGEHFKHFIPDAENEQEEI